MRRPLLVAAAALLIAAACQASTEPQPVPVSAAQVSLKPQDVPVGLQRCAASGPIEGYLKVLKPGGGTGYRDLAAAWQRARSGGADSADLTIFTDDPASCTSGLIAATGRSAASLSVRYSKPQAAARAWGQGLLDLPLPAPDEQAPGLSQGFSTGLGGNSWSYERTAASRTTFVAFWQNGSFAILVATGGLAADQSRIASGAVDSRVR